jgi:hypothetical protein
MDEGPVTAAVNRCATQNQVQQRLKARSNSEYDRQIIHD